MLQFQWYNILSFQIGIFDFVFLLMIMRMFYIQRTDVIRYIAEKKSRHFLFRFGCQQNFHRKYHEYIHIYFGRIHSSRENVIFNLLKDFDIPFISVNQWISFRIERNSLRFSFVCIHNGKQQYSNNNINHFRKTFRQMNASSGWVSISLILI